MTHERIHRDPQVMVGKPVIKGARITVELPLREIAADTSFDDSWTDYAVTEPDVRAALGFAADFLRSEAAAQRRARAGRAVASWSSSWTGASGPGSAFQAVRG